MANWTGVITNAGNNVLLEWINEKTLHFDSAAAGQGTVETVGMLAQTALVNQKQVASIIGAERVSMGIRLKIRITAPQAAYTLNQYGVWASITGGSTTMIALFQHEKGIPIPSAAESPDFVYTFYALISTSNTGKWTVNIDTSASVTLEEMNAAIATAVATKEGVIKDASEKDSLADADCIAVVDSADGGKTKRVLWSTVKAALAKLFVPLTRKINGKVLSSDVMLTGEDVKVSGSDETSISSSLSNKMELIALPTQDLSNAPQQLFTTLTGITGVTGLPDGWPQSRHDFVRLWCGNLSYTLDFIASYATKKLAYRLATGQWAEVATATPPQEYNLPLAEGWIAHRGSVYFKTQDNVVTVYFQVKNATAQSGEVTLATLPAGFRPINLIGGSGYCAIPGGKYSPADMKVYPDGNITGFNDVGVAEYYTGFFTFVADS